MTMYSLQLLVTSESLHDITELARHITSNSNFSHDATTLGDMPHETESSVPAPAPNYTNFGVNVYESSEHAFALGKKLYADANEAREKQTRNGGWVDSFDFGIDLATGTVRSSGATPTSDARYFNVLREGDGIKFGRGFDSQYAAECNADASHLATVWISLDDNDGVHVGV